jgi:hypothetical protein
MGHRLKPDRTRAANAPQSRTIAAKVRSQTVFDIRHQTDRANAVTPDDLDLAAFGSDPLPRPALRCLRYLADIEAHTIRYLRDLLVTPSHTDAVVTEFLTAWAFQQYWLNETLEAVLAAHVNPPTSPPQSPVRQVAQKVNDRIAPIRQAVVGNLVGDEFVAVHMTWGAANERLAEVIYRELGAREDHPALTPALNRIADQKIRHVTFYEEQARLRLEGSARARATTSFALRRLAFAYPAGAVVRPKSESRFVLHYVFDNPQARSRLVDVDRAVAALPGLTGLAPVTKAMAGYGIGTEAVSG